MERMVQLARDTRGKATHYPSYDPGWHVPESQRHKLFCALLYELLVAAAGPRATVASDLFVYFEEGNARRRCAPDGLVKLDHPTDPLDSYLVWEHGVPELCIEILSPSDTKEKLTLPQKLARFEAMRVPEVVVFNADSPVGERVRAWDFVRGALAPRNVAHERTRCKTLGLWFVVAPHPNPRVGACLRLARDAAGADLVLSPAESERMAREQERAAKEQERAAKEQERAAKEQERAAKEQERAARETAEAEREAALAEVARLRAELARANRGRRAKR